MDQEQRDRLYELQHAVWPAWSVGEGNAAALVDFLAAWLALAPGSAVLDLGCGVGREAAELAARGFIVVGVDHAAALVQAARERAARRGLGERATFTRGDIRNLHTSVVAMEGTSPVRGPFDVVLMLDSTLNVFSDEEMAAILRGAVDVLSPGGTLVVEQLNPAYWDKPAERLQIASDGIGPGHTEREYRFDRETGTLIDQVIYHPPGAAEPVELPPQELRLLQEGVLRTMLEAAGLRDLEAVGTEGFSYLFPPPPPTRASASMLIRGRRA